MTKTSLTQLVIASDIHDDLEALNALADYSRCQKVDAIIIAGDLSLRPYTAQDLEELLKSKGEDESFPQEALRTFVHKKTEHNQRVLSAMNGILASSGIPYFVIPGNYDPLLTNIFGKKDLHLKTTSIGKSKVAGYGGADEYPQHISLLVQLGQIVPYSDDELHSFLTTEQPDICVIHNPPQGLCDALYTGNHAGTPALRKYIEEHAPKLVISGHIHESGPNSNNPLGIAGVGIYKNCSTEQVTICVNPGNFGRYDLVDFPSLDTQRTFDHGTFMRVDLEDGTPVLVRSFTMQPQNERGNDKVEKRTLDNSITKIAQYSLTEINYNAMTKSVFHPPNQLELN